MFVKQLKVLTPEKKKMSELKVVSEDFVLSVITTVVQGGPITRL